jgi:hypothetical protein
MNVILSEHELERIKASAETLHRFLHFSPSRCRKLRSNTSAWLTSGKSLLLHPVTDMKSHRIPLMEQADLSVIAIDGTGRSGTS